MKKVLLWMVLLTVCASIQQCDNDEPVVSRKVQFNLGVPSSTNSPGRTMAITPDALILSVRRGLDPVFTSKRIALLQVGTSLMTEPIDLPSGEVYTITDFLLVDESNEVIYAVPQAGSPLASAVSNPLPFNFSVGSDIVTSIDIEVVSVLHSAPEDFGYASFNIHEVDINTLKVAVFTNADNELTLTTAFATIHRNDEELGSYSLDATTNVLSFVGEPGDTYRLIVSKPGFTTIRQEFVYSDLIELLDGAPLKIIFSQFTMMAIVEETEENSFDVRVGAIDGMSLDIDWGDGTTGHVTQEGELEAQLSHIYASQGIYPVVVSGDLDHIRSFTSVYGAGKMNAIDVTSLVNLQDMRILLTRGPARLDLSRNKSLTNVDISGVRELEDVILPEISNIVTINFEGPNQLSTADVDDMIDKIYNSAVLHDTHDGVILLDTDWIFNTHLMVGPPSAATVIKLQELRNNYNWNIVPDPGS